MSKSPLRFLSYSNVMATLAVFIALGGSAYALSLGKGDVKSKHIAKNAVRSAHVKDRALLLKDIKGGQELLGSRGYAQIDGSGWNEAASKGVVSAGHPSPTLANYERYWCFNLTFKPKNAVATPAFGSASTVLGIIDNPSSYCPPAQSDAGVHTFGSGGTFYVAFN